MLTMMFQASQCAALVEAKSKIADDPWPLMPPGGEEALMAKMPKTVSSEQVRQVVKVYMGEMKKKLDKQIDKCNYDPQSRRINNIAVEMASLFRFTRMKQ